tara:strand:- start:46 stop:696 length:651 start_codon:yes stop_codon:yes gene_type:complete
MKTNFLHFKSIGSQTFVATDAQTNFVINGANFWDVAITADTQVKVEVTFKEAQTTKCGSAYSGGSVDAGETVTVNDTGKSLSTNDIVIANQGADGTNGITISAGDIVTITVIPTEDTEALFRADRFLGVEANASGTVVVASFKSMKSVAAAAGDDTITFTITNDSGVKNMKDISQGILEALNANSNGGVVTVLDRLNKVGTLQGVGAISKMVIAVA